METGYECRLLFTVFIMRFQENSTKRRTQCQGIQCRQTDSNSHRHTELAIEYTGCTSHKTYRDKHGHHHQCNRNDRSAKFTHCIDRCLFRRFVSLVQLGMDPLDDDYGIVDHNRNGKYHRTKRQQVNAEPDQ